MRLFATGFSKPMFGLLIVALGGVSNMTGEEMKYFSINDLSEEPQTTRARNEVPLKDQWDVAALYPDLSSWKKEFEGVFSKEKSPRFPELASYKGKLSDPKILAKAFDLSFELERRLTKLYTYAHLRFDEDVGNDSAKHDFGLITGLFHDFGVETSWIEPELLALKEADFQKLVKHPALKAYQFHLEKLAERRPHTLSLELEEMMALSGKALQTSSKAFGALNNADLTFEDAIDANGQRRPLTQGSFQMYLKDSDRVLRKSAFENIYKSYRAHENTLAELLSGKVEAHVYHAKARKFQSALESALKPNNIEIAVYDNLIASVREYLPVMHDYIALRKKVLGLDELHVYDLYVPLVQEKAMKIGYDEAAQTVIASVAPLGPKYQEALKSGLTQSRWVDVYENKRKRSGAYSSGCYDSMPYILMNYNGTFDSMLTLAHEAGHSMHSFLSNKNQPYVYSQYPIFVAEVASTFNEQLLMKHCKEKANREGLVQLINHEIEKIRGTIFRQTLFAEFEKKIHELAEAGTPLTPALLGKIYLDLNRDYYGPELVLDPEISVEWSRIPHFYYNFYVYQYATGLSAALTLFQKAMASSEGRDRYLQFLSSGCSAYPLDLLKRAGVDMRKKEAVGSALEYFKGQVEELKKYIQ